MDILGLLIVNLIPLYIIIALGFVAGRKLDVELPSIAAVVIYVIAPVVNFGAMVQLEFDVDYIALPAILFCFSGLLGIAVYVLAGRAFQNTTANLVAMSSVTGNTGYFGLPLVLTFFDPQYAGLYLFMNMAVLLNESGLGYYLGARGHADIKGAVIKVLKLPVVHAIWLGLLVNALNINLPDIMVKYWHYATGTWVILGMMIIGIALSKQRTLQVDARLLTWLFIPRFILWPLAGWGIIMADALIFHLYDATLYQMIAIFTAVPLAGNLVAYASTLKLHPERAAASVLLSTFLALLSVSANLLLVRQVFGLN